MALPKLVLWLVLAVVGLFVLSAVATAVFAAIAFVWMLVRLAVTIAILGGLLYGGYKLYGLLSGGSSNERLSLSTGTTETTYSRPEDPVEDLQQQYTNGELTEAELERRLERQMVDDELDSIDRELQRERS